MKKEKQPEGEREVERHKQSFKENVKNPSGKDMRRAKRRV